MSDGSSMFIGLIFVTVVLLSQALIVPVFGESRKTRKRLKQRLGDLERQSGEEAYSSLLRAKYLKKLSPWEQALESLPAMEALAGMIEQAGRTTLAYRVVLLSGILAIVCGVVGWAAMNMVMAGVVAGIVGGALPFMKLMHERGKRVLRFEEQLPDAIDTMKRALQAGHPFSGSIKMIAEEMEDPIASEFDRTFADLNYGNDVRRAMLGLLQRVPSVPVMALVTSVLVQKETGGNLAEILGQISSVIRGRFRLERKVKTLSAEGRMSTWILALVPIVLFGVIWITTPDYLPTLTESEVGQWLILYGIVSGMIGIIWIRRIIRIDV